MNREPHPRPFSARRGVTSSVLHSPIGEGTGVRLFLFLLLLHSPFSVLCSQETHWEFSLGAEYMLTAYSFRSSHNTWGTGFEAVWMKTENGKWKKGKEELSAAPFSWGVKFDFGLTPQSICGNRFGMVAMLRDPLNPRLSLDMGVGLSSYTKPNYRTGNPGNVYISTPVACLIDVGLVASLTDRSHLALRLLHSSNGNMRRPNRGLNYFRLELGISAPPPENGKRKTENLEYPGAAAGSPFSVSRSAEASCHELGFTLIPSLTFSRHNLQSGLFFCYDLALNYEYHTSPAMAYGATVDLWYNFSHPWQLPRYHDSYTFPMYVSALLFFERFWGPVSLKGGIGGVIAASSRVLVPVYERLAVYYNFGRHYAGIGINAHLGQAEYIEWSYGYRIPIGKR